VDSLVRITEVLAVQVVADQLAVVAEQELLGRVLLAAMVLLAVAAVAAVLLLLVQQEVLLAVLAVMVLIGLA
jgi:hypothetical protein